MVVGLSPLVATEISGIMSVSSKEFLDSQLITESRFTPKHVCDMISQCTMQIVLPTMLTNFASVTK